MAQTAAKQLVTLGRDERHAVALVGNPNTGKSTLFNALTGLRQRVANYPGATVDFLEGSLPLEQSWVDLYDLPGLYSLSAHAPDELVAFELLMGELPDTPAPEAVVVVLDSTNLERNLFLYSQIAELGLKTVVALTMVDTAEQNRLEVDADELSRRLGVPVVPVVASTGRGLDDLLSALDGVLRSHGSVPALRLLPSHSRAARGLVEQWCGDRPGRAADVEFERALVDVDGQIERRLVEMHGTRLLEQLRELRKTLGRGRSLVEIDAEARYAWARATLSKVLESRSRAEDTWSERLDAVLSHPVGGTLLFLALMAAVFQAVFSWAAPLMDGIDAATAMLAESVRWLIGDGWLASLLSDGVVSGVGAVVVFLPQILILFLFIIVLEDSGYMARAAFLVDRLMRACGLSGQSFIPMLSSFACAVPGIMATRIIPSRRDRFATILAAPFMTCSARLPVYAVLIAAIVPDQRVGPLNLRGLVLLGLYVLGVLGGIATAFLLKRTLLRGPTPTFVMEMPPYRLPSWRSVGVRLLERARVFLLRAGTIIFCVAVVVWALVSYPRSSTLTAEYDERRTTARAELSGTELDERLAELDNAEAAAQLEVSALGRVGRLIEPVFRPLGWDWKVTSAVLAAFPAREVVIAVLGTIYAVGDDVDESDAGLLERIRSSSWSDGRPVFTTPMALGLMVFFAFCLQCGATMAAMRRETGSWRWPLFAWSYMTTLGYLGALVVYQVGTRLSG